MTYTVHACGGRPDIVKKMDICFYVDELKELLIYPASDSLQSDDDCIKVFEGEEAIYVGAMSSEFEF
jgi:hypothetical protein